MGVNAQIEVPAFTAGQVLTAAEMTQINTGIPVFATTVTRDAAFGGAGEKVLAEGQFAYIEATNTTQYYDGAAWQAVSSGQGLTVVKAETAFSAVGTITVDNIFTSSYTNYKIMMTYTSATGANQDIQLRVGGVTATAANYSYQNNQGNGTSITGSRTTAASFSVGAANGAFNSSCNIDLYSPFVATGTVISSQIAYSAGAYTTPIITDFRGAHSVATAYDGFILTMTGTCTGSYTVYGYGKSL
jgi:hypothetical protein